MAFIQGVYVATITPFDSHGAIDWPALKKHLGFLVDSGVHGLVVAGTTGESATLSRDEKCRLISFCLEQLSSTSAELIVGCGGNNTADVVDQVAEAEELGAVATLIVTPYYNKPTPQGLVAHYTHIADRCQKPVILYHVPGRTSVHLPLEQVETLFAHPRIAGIKEASGQYSYWLGLADVAARAQKKVLAGDDDAFAVCQALGGDGIISASANVVPAHYVELYTLMKENRWPEAFALQRRLAPLVKALFSETNPAPIKYVLSQCHGVENRLRLPLVPIASKTENTIQQSWETFFGERLAP